jgi:hypothetical protein
MVMQLCCTVVGTWEITHADFTTIRPDIHGRPATTSCIPVGLAFHVTEIIPLPHLLLTRLW